MAVNILYVYKSLLGIHQQRRGWKLLSELEEWLRVRCSPSPGTGRRAADDELLGFG